MPTTEHPNHEVLEAARVAAMDVATLVNLVKGTLSHMQTATDGSADWMTGDVRDNARKARLRLDSLDRLLESL